MTVLALVREPEEEHPAPDHGVIRLVVGRDAQVAKWVRHQLPEHPDFGLCTAIGIARDKRLIAGIVYNNYHDYMVEASIAAIDPRWATRRVLWAIFFYPFEQLKVRRLQVTCAKHNKHTRKFNERLGFQYEGTGREAWPDGSGACVYSMLRKECRWLKETPNG